MDDTKDLIFDWNLEPGPIPGPARKIEFDDETLRDGLQSPSVTDPPIEKKIEILHLMNDLGIQTADIGLPAAGPRAQADVLRLAEEIVRSKMKLVPNCAARTMPSDIDPIIEVSQKTGIPIEACTFLGSSPIRLYTEGWTVDKLLGLTETAVKYAVGNGLPCMMVTEDTTRANPETLRRIYTTAIECGAKRVCVADTTGHSTPEGAAAVIRFIRSVVDATGEDIKVDWHGHNDRGLGLINCIAAAAAGADRIHGTALGVGERVGNAALDQVLVNFKLLGWIDNDLSKLNLYCRTVSEATCVEIPINYPVVGRDAYRTATGVHAAAVIKAEKRGDQAITDAVYSGVPAAMFGLEQCIEIGPMSGVSNVTYWLAKRNIKADEDLVQDIFAMAKSSATVLTEAEVLRICSKHGIGSARR